MNGNFESPVRYEEEILTGFTQAYQAVLDCKEEFKMRLRDLEDTKIRSLAADTQRYSMLLSSSYHPSLLKDGADREIFLYSLWRGRDDEDKELVEKEVLSLLKGDIPYFAVESGWGYVVSENSKNKDPAWDFVKYCMEPENAKEFNLGTGTVASLKAIIDDEGYQSDERNVRVSDQYQYLQYARSVGPVQDMDFVKKTLLDTFTKAASGSIGTDEALEEMETSINNHIQELLKQAK